MTSKQQIGTAAGEVPWLHELSNDIACAAPCVFRRYRMGGILSESRRHPLQWSTGWHCTPERPDIAFSERHAMRSMFSRLRFALLSRAAIASTVFLLAACGGGGGGDSGDFDGNPLPAPPPVVEQPFEPGAPLVTGDIATDGLNWMNFRRQQIGLPALARNTALDNAARGHSRYQRLNGELTHTQIVGLPGFTGVTEVDRIANAGYSLIPATGFAAGEVLAATGDSSGVATAEALIAAIYHRYIIFEPVFKDIGTGVDGTADGFLYFTANLAAGDGLGFGLRSDEVAVYPYPNQQGVPSVFFSDTESPDPVAEFNEVGYPVSVHTNLGGTIAVSTFTIRSRSGVALPARLLTAATDNFTPTSAAALVPLRTLVPGMTYDVQFTGAVNNAPVALSWSFTAG